MARTRQFWLSRSLRAPALVASAVLALVASAALVGAAGPLPEAPPQGTDTAPPDNAEPAGPRHIRLLLTTDEHGWLEPLTDPDSGERLGGIVALYRELLEDRLGDPDVALLSVGDMWTGPYQSTLLRGEPMVRAFNRMGYAAAAIGNHDFDFGIEVLEKRRSEAAFPLLGANLRDRATGLRPAWAEASTILHVGGIRLGVIGLSPEDTPRFTDARQVARLEFLPYTETLEREVPALRARGADQIVVLIHDRLEAAVELTPTLRRLGISVVGAGHRHQAGNFTDTGSTPDRVADDIVFCNAGPFMRQYCRIDLSFENGVLLAGEALIRPVSRPRGASPEPPDPALASIVRDADERTKWFGAEALIEAPRPVNRDDGTLGQLIVDSWLWDIPRCDAAIINAGGIRQSLGAGTVHVRDIVSVLPFDNDLVIVELSGRELREVLARGDAIAGGVRYSYRETADGRTLVGLTTHDGTPIPDDARLEVIVHEFMYQGGDGYEFAAHDPEPEPTAIDWREPLIRYLRVRGRKKLPLLVEAEPRALRLETEPDPSPRPAEKSKKLLTPGN